MAGSIEYEFDSAQNELLRKLGGRMKWVARFMVALSVVLVIGGIAALGDDAGGPITQAVLTFVLALWTRRAAAAFESMAETEGSDISNLMYALTQLRKLYTLQYWVMLLAIVLAGVGVLAALGVLVSGRGP